MLRWLKVQAYNCILLYTDLAIYIQIVGQKTKVISGNQCIQIVQLLIKQYYYRRLKFELVQL